MFPGGGGMDDRKMQQMMKQMGIDMQELDAEEVIIRTPDEELVFTDADVQRMDAQGQQTYTIVGEAESRPRGDGGDTGAAGADTADSEDSGGPVIEESEGDGETEIPEEDVELVASQAGASKSEAREALEDADGEPAAAIAQLK